MSYESEDCKDHICLASLTQSGKIVITEMKLNKSSSNDHTFEGIFE